MEDASRLIATAWTRRVTNRVPLLCLFMVTIVALLAVGQPYMGTALEATPGPSISPVAVAEESSVDLDREIREEELERLRNQNARGLLPWLGRNITGTAVAATLVAIYTVYRWKTDRTDEVDRRTEARFQESALALGSTEAEMRVAAAVTLRSFLSPKLHRFHAQVFDLAVGHLRLIEAPRRDVGECIEVSSQSPTADALTRVMVESYQQMQSASVRRRASRSVDARGVRIIRGSLRGANLENIDFGRAVMLHTDFRSAAMSGCAMDDLDAFHASFWKADLSNTTAREPRFDDAYFLDAVLDHSQWTRAYMKRAYLVNARALAVRWPEVHLEDAELDGANFTSAQLDRAYLLRARLIRTNFTGASLVHAEISNAKAVQAVFVRSNLEQSIFIGANLMSADFSQARLVRTEFREAVLTYADFTGSDLTGSDIETAKALQGARLGGAIGLSSVQLEICRALGASIDPLGGDEKTKGGSTDVANPIGEAESREQVRADE